MLTVKVKPETDKEYRHWEIWAGKEYLGYFTKNTSEYRVRGENWNFTSKSDIQYFHAKTKAEILQKVEAQVKGEYVVLNQHCGIVVYLN